VLQSVQGPEPEEVVEDDDSDCEPGVFSAKSTGQATDYPFGELLSFLPFFLVFSFLPFFLSHLDDLMVHGL